MHLQLIVAIDEDWGIGKNGSIPWHEPDDLKHFRRVTSGYPVIMGRKTWESIPEHFRPLKNRCNHVLSSNPPPPLHTDPGVMWHFDTERALEAVKHWNYVTVIGGETLYRQYLDRVDSIYLTRVPGKYNCDTFFPYLPEELWSFQYNKALNNKGLKYEYYKRIRQ